MSKYTSPRRGSTRVAGSVALAILLAWAVSACGDGSDTANTNAAAASTVASENATTLPPGTVKITLADVSATSMLLTPAPTSAPSGTVTFIVTNAGDKEHEFVVLDTDLGAGDLPFNDAANRVIEETDGVTPIDEIESIMPGETLEMVVDLEAGHYALICNLEGHYKMGMWSDFDVS